MAGITSLNTAISGMQAAQAGLYVVGHNMANSGVAGYSRQRVNQNESFYSNIAYTKNGYLQVGLGTNVSSIQQIRNQFLDGIYRKEVSRLSFHEAKMMTGKEIETAMGELDASYNLQNSLKGIWDSLNELSVYQPGLETRGNFLNMCITFLDKANDISDVLNKYQRSLDTEVRETVTEINNLVEKIDGYNKLISKAEATGDKANDYRDERNNALDNLSKLIDITYTEKNGVVDVMAGDNTLLCGGSINKIGLKYTVEGSSFVEPVFTTSTSILPVDAPVATYVPVFSYKTAVDPEHNNDKGKLLGLIVSRGMMQGTYATSPAEPDAADTAKYPGGVNDPQYKLDKRKHELQVFSSEYCMVPGIMRDLDTIVHSIVTMINDAMAPATEAGLKDYENAPYDLNHEQSFTEVFVRKHYDRFDEEGNLIPEDPNDPSTLYTLGNIIINPKLQNQSEGGVDIMSLSMSDDHEDNEVVKQIMKLWETKTITMHGASDKLTIYESYYQFVNNLANTTRESESIYYAQETIVLKTDNERSQVAGVSMDEETSNMLKYQYAYNASARMLNVIDSMLDKLINGTGRVGL